MGPTETDRELEQKLEALERDSLSRLRERLHEQLHGNIEEHERSSSWSYALVEHEIRLLLELMPAAVEHQERLLQLREVLRRTLLEGESSLQEQAKLSQLIEEVSEAIEGKNWKFSELRGPGHAAIEGVERVSQLYTADSVARIEQVRAGLPVMQTVELMTTDLGITIEDLYELLGITPSAAAHKLRVHEPLDTSASERALFVAGLVKMVEEMIPENAAGAGDFDAAKWVARWLGEPQPALAGKTPKSYLDTADGRAIVHRLLGQMESGAYA